MNDLHLFPFEFINKNSKIIIYGAGNVGRDYLQQIWISKWCEVLMIVDKNYQNCSATYAPVCSPDKITEEIDYDYVVIAIDSAKIIYEVEQYLINCGIPKNKIIGIADRYQHQILGELDFVCEANSDVVNTQDVWIAFCLIGGLGDYIISLKLLEEIIRIAPELKVDVFGKYEMANTIYKSNNNVNEVIDSGRKDVDMKKYDICLSVEHVIHVEKLNYNKIYNSNPELANKFKEVINTFSKYYVDIPLQQYRDAIFIKRASFNKVNRYTALNHNGIFNIQDKKVHIGYDNNFLEPFTKMKLNSYITLNRGADDVLRDGRMQTKVWPQKYYIELIKKLHKLYPNVEIVQLGGKNAEKIEGVDRCVLGENFELIKYILKNAMLHFDCEGGLVHLATQLGTKCAVVFGPTPVDYYGYEENINIISKECNNCMGVTFDWFVNCYRGLEKQICMYSLTPDIVLEKIQKYLDSVMR